MAMRHNGRNTCRIAASRLPLTDCSTGQHNTTIYVLYFTLSGNALAVCYCIISLKRVFLERNLIFGFIDFRPTHLTERFLERCLSLILVALYGCSQHANPLGQGHNELVLRRGLAGEPASLDPAAAADTFSTQVVQDLYEGLTSESPAGEVVPGVAYHWEVDPTGRKYTFYLRSDARWSNGEPVRAQEFLASWRRVLDPKQGSPVSNDLRLIVGAAEIISGLLPPTSLGVTVPSDNVLVVNLERPAPYFPQLLAHSAAFPIYSDSSARTHNPRAWISDGPYILSSWQPGTRVELVQNLHYWDRSNVHIPQIEYQIAPDQNSQFAAYRAGQLDMTDTVPPNAIASFRNEHSNEIVIAPYLATAYYGLNFPAQPFNGNLNLRKALAMAVDRRRLVTALSLGQIPAYGFVPPGTLNYNPQHWEWEKLSDIDRVAEARRLYAEAGYSIHTPLHLRLLFNSNPAIKQTAIMIAAMWKEELGIDTELTDEEFRVFLQSRHDKRRWEVIRSAWNADYNDASNFLDIFRANSSNNDTGYSNSNFDQVLDKAAITVDQDIRRDLLETAEQMMLADYPSIPLYFYVSKRLVKPYVLGVIPNPLDRVSSKALVILPH
ncbi:MAG: peptide ABC transporter substrate-binding protein [Steroidobacteraceae bacterium]